MLIRKSNRPYDFKKDRLLKITSLQNDLDSCNLEIKRLKKISVDSMSATENLTFQHNLEIEIKKRKIIKDKLTSFGVLEKRGRPKKADEEKYLNKHSKFTAMLKPENLDYLKALKNNGTIDNISSFLDKLIEEYISRNHQ